MCCKHQKKNRPDGLVDKHWNRDREIRGSILAQGRSDYASPESGKQSTTYWVVLAYPNIPQHFFLKPQKNNSSLLISQQFNSPPILVHIKRQCTFPINILFTPFCPHDHCPKYPASILLTTLKVAILYLLRLVLQNLEYHDYTPNSVLIP